MQELENIMADARAMQLLLEIPHSDETNPRVQAAKFNCKRILETCELISKRMKTPIPSSVKQSAPECEDANEKIRLLEQSRLAGEFIIPFGKFKGKSVKTVPTSYLCWLLGVRRVGRQFENIPMDKHGWIVSNHPDVIAQVKAYFTWRCWACGACNTRFEFSKLCPACWHE